MLINYFKERTRPTSFNLFVARCIFGFYAIWKTLSYQFDSLQNWPAFLFYRSHDAIGYFISAQLHFLPVEKWIVVILLLLFIAGWRMGLVTFLSVMLLTHMGSLHVSVSNQANTWALPIFYLVFFGLFREYSTLSMDGYKRTNDTSQNVLNEELKKHVGMTTPMSVLMWILIFMASTYFFTGTSKLIVSGLSWLDAEHLPLMAQVEIMMYHNSMPPLAQIIVDNTPIAVLSVWLSVALECAFLLFVVFRLPIWIPIFGLAGMHIMIFISLNIFFLDQFFFYALFIPWDRLNTSTKGAHRLKVVYDDACNFCARSLVVLRHVDTGSIVDFYGPSETQNWDDIPKDIDYSKAMYAFRDGEMYRGYYAFREILATNYVLRPITWVMGIGPVAALGERVYDFVARNRHTLSICSVPTRDGE